MRKLGLTLLALLSTLWARAYDYPYLVFQHTSGDITAVSVTDLTLTSNGTQLQATNNAGTQSFVLSNLNKMYFSTDGVTAIDALLATEGETLQVFQLSGVAVGKYNSLSAALQNLPTGIYVAKTKNKTQKIVVK